MSTKLPKEKAGRDKTQGIIQCWLSVKLSSCGHHMQFYMHYVSKYVISQNLIHSIKLLNFKVNDSYTLSNTIFLFFLSACYFFTLYFLKVHLVVLGLVHFNIVLQWMHNTTNKKETQATLYHLSTFNG